MKIAALVILTAFTFVLTKLSAQDPLRVGVDVKEPRLVKKVEIDYPEEAKIARIDSPNVLQLLRTGHRGTFPCRLVQPFSSTFFKVDYVYTIEYSSNMRFEWDEIKNRSNYRKHGVWFRRSPNYLGRLNIG